MNVIKTITLFLFLATATPSGNSQKNDTTKRVPTPQPVLAKDSFYRAGPTPATDKLIQTMAVVDNEAKAFVPRTMQEFQMQADKIAALERRLADRDSQLAWLKAHPDTVVKQALVTRTIRTGLQEIPGTPQKKREKALRDVQTVYRIVQKVEDDTTGYAYHPLH